MELRIPKQMTKFFWSLFPFVFIFISSNAIFSTWKLQHYRFHEIEDFGRLLFILGISACESALIVTCLGFIISFLKKFQHK